MFLSLFFKHRFSLISLLLKVYYEIKVRNSVTENLLVKLLSTNLRILESNLTEFIKIDTLKY